MQMSRMFLVGGFCVCDYMVELISVVEKCLYTLADCSVFASALHVLRPWGFNGVRLGACRTSIYGHCEAQQINTASDLLVVRLNNNAKVKLTNGETDKLCRIEYRESKNGWKLRTENAHICLFAMLDISIAVCSGV